MIASQVEYIRKKYDIEVPLILMDSYNTQEDSLAEFKKIGFKQKITTSFLQSQ